MLSTIQDSFYPCDNKLMFQGMSYCKEEAHQSLFYYLYPINQIGPLGSPYAF